MLIPGILASSVQKSTGAFDSIATVTLSSNASSVTFSSIPSTYSHLQIAYTAKNTGAGITDMNLTLNGDTAGNYNKHWAFTFDGGGPYTSTDSSNLSVGYLYGGDSGVYSSGIIDLYDYQSNSKYKTIRYITANDKSSTQTTTVVYGSGLWRNTNGVSSITLTCPTIASGGKFALYGIKGA